VGAVDTGETLPPELMCCDEQESGDRSSRLQTEPQARTIFGGQKEPFAATAIINEPSEHILVERKDRLKKLILDVDNPALLFADHVDQYGIDFFQMISEKNLEGMVAKRRGSPYSRSAKWIKIKNPSYTHSEGRNELFEKSK